MKLIAILIALTLPLSAQYRMGYIPDNGKVSPPFSLKRGVSAAVIKPASDLTPLMPPIQNQGNLGSCTGNGVARILDYAHRLKTGKFYTPSRLFIYYNERAMEGTINEDSGAMIADGILSVNKLGAASERCWPYDITKFNKKPKSDCYKSALNKQALKFYKLDNGDGTSIRKALSMGFPVVFGCYVYNAIYDVNAAKYVVPMPAGKPIGGHCMVITGHDDSTQLYTVDNSWGTEWGRGGRCAFQYAYIHNRRITDDAWVIEIAE